MRKFRICKLLVSDGDKYEVVELPLYLKNVFITRFGLMEVPTLLDFEPWLEETIAYSQIEKLNLTLPNSGEKVKLL